MPVNRSSSSTWAKNSGDQLNHSCLARAIMTEEAEDFTLVYFQGDIIDSSEFTKLLS
jgi:hypothetical protein